MDKRQTKINRLKEISEKMARLIEADKDRNIFGAFSHKYHMNPPLPEHEIKMFEAEYGIKLPEEYSLYLSGIANGGAGPFYGLMSLNENDGAEVDPSKPFPFTKEMPLILMDLYNKIDKMDKNDEKNEDNEEYEDALGHAYEDAEKGVIYLAHEGCGMYSVLVVNGQERGNVWFFDFSNDFGACPLADPKTGGPMGFFDWFELWLDASLTSIKTGTEKLGSYMDYIDESISQKLEAAFSDYTAAANKSKQLPEVYTESERDAVEAHINKYFGKYANVFHEIESPDIHVDIYVVDPTPERNYYTLVTAGAGAHKMNVPEELADRKLDRAEILVTLPPGWKLPIPEKTDDEKWYWPLHWMKNLARLSGNQGTWLGYGHTVHSDEPFAENTELSYIMLTMPYFFEAAASACKLPDGSEVNFYQMLPLYADEAEFRTEFGTNALEECFPEDFDLVIDVGRANVVQDNICWQIRSHFKAAQKYNEKGDYTAAILESEAALMRIEKLPDGVTRYRESYLFEAYYRLATNYMNLEHYGAAVDWYDKAISIYPSWCPESQYDRYTFRDMRLFYWRGWCKTNEGDRDGAQEDFQKSLAAEETFRGDIYCSLAKIHNAALRYNVAALLYQSAIDEYTKDRGNAFSMFTLVEVVFGYGVARLGAQEYADALRFFAEAIRLNSKHWKAYHLASLSIACLSNAALAEKLEEMSQKQSCEDVEIVLAKIQKFLGER